MHKVVLENEFVDVKLITKVSLANHLIYLAGTTRALCDRTQLADLAGRLFSPSAGLATFA